jgi:hypothetical protein
MMRSDSVSYYLICVQAAVACVLLALPIATALGFSRGDYKPGGKEYPRPNPSPTKRFIIHGTIDSALQIEFDAIYRVTNKACMHSTLSSYIEGAGTLAPSASVPLAMQRESTQFQVNVSIDGVFPGRCGWVFQGVIGRTKEQDIFNGGIMAAGGWIVSGWRAYPGQPTPNPTVTAACYVPRISIPDDAKYGVGNLTCNRGSPWAMISKQTTSVTLNISEGQWYGVPK